MAPTHSNPGDAAIWCGEIALLRDLGISISYASSYRNYDPEQLLRHHDEGPILLHGGGNFGDLYPAFEHARRRILRDFPDRNIIQLPQSLWFAGNTLSGNGANASAAWRVSTNRTLLVRERQSLALAHTTLGTGVRTGLTPDHALGLAAQMAQLGSKVKPTMPVMAVLRRDIESAQRTPGVTMELATLSRRWWPVPVEDWPHESEVDRRGWPDEDQRDWASLLLWDRAQPGSTDAWLPMPRAIALIERALHARVTRAALRLAQAELVVTDRLHASLLAWMLGRRVVLLPNSYHKNRSTYLTWFANDPRFEWADNLRECLAIVGGPHKQV